MKYTIEPRDFDEAVKQDWHWFECVLAQCSRRNQMFMSDGVTPYVMKLSTGEGDKVRSIFDEHYLRMGDEKKPELVALRASLPIEINLP